MTEPFFPTGRDRGVTVAVEGFFAFVWFAWGQVATLRAGRPLYGDPSDGLRLPRSQPEGEA